MKNIYSELPRPFFVLAPMDDVTDTVFRRLIAEWAKPDLFFTEFASADGLQSNGRQAVLKKLKVVSDDERPLIAQIWGLDPEKYYKTAQEIAEMGFDGLDINMGCPVPKVVKHGACSALINNRELASKLINSAKDGLGGKLPISVKTRIGFKTIDLSWIEFLLQHELDSLTVHTRTVKEQSKVEAHHDVLAEIVVMRNKISPKTKIVANGDITSREMGLELAEKYDLDGLMIGRGVFNDPFVFAAESPWETMLPHEKLKMYIQHVNLFEETWPQANPNALKKFCKVYVNGFEGAGEVRSRIMETSNLDEIKKVIEAVDL